MKDRLRGLIDYIKSKNIDYADARYVERKNESITVKDGQLEALSRDEGRGIGVRVLHGGCWGFAASASITPSDLKKLADRAIGIAKASAMTKGKPTTLAPVQAYQDSYVSPMIENPFEVSL
ncbi:MAG TPA: hypothetical protein DCZ43_03690, partial [candidate division Zixibacteria bacterium]|nr:hypothetical protein [candidate division Zixibacteria bacterium]